jgi:hypothetical protein
VGSVLIYLLPLVIGSIAMPTWVLLVFVLLRSGDRVVEALAFVAGVTLVRLLQGLVFGLAVSLYDITQGKYVPEPIFSILLLITGLLLMAIALGQMIAYRTNRHNAPSPRWLTLIHDLTPVKALGLGALLVVTSSKAWLFTLTAIGVISQAELSPLPSLIAFLFYVLGADLLIVAPIILAVRSGARFEAMAHWLESHNRAIVIVITLIIGSIFVWRGATGLIA